VETCEIGSKKSRNKGKAALTEEKMTHRNSSLSEKIQRQHNHNRLICFVRIELTWQLLIINPDVESY